MTSEDREQYERRMLARLWREAISQARALTLAPDDYAALVGRDFAHLVLRLSKASPECSQMLIREV